MSFQNCYFNTSAFNQTAESVAGVLIKVKRRRCYRNAATEEHNSEKKSHTNQSNTRNSLESLSRRRYKDCVNDFKLKMSRTRSKQNRQKTYCRSNLKFCSYWAKKADALRLKPDKNCYFFFGRILEILKWFSWRFLAGKFLHFYNLWQNLSNTNFIVK